MATKQFKRKYASVHWSVEDIVDTHNLSEAHAHEFLEENERYIVQAMTEAGWDAIATFIGDYKSPTSKGGKSK